MIAATKTIVGNGRLAALVIVTSVATLLGLYSAEPSFRAKFGPIDDHEPLYWMGTGSRVSPADALDVFYNQTEVGDWGKFLRFRPAYYAVRVGQAIVFGDHPLAWHLSVFVAFVITCAALGYAAFRWLEVGLPDATNRVHLAAAALATAVFCGMETWAGIIGRLGPSEQLGLLAASFVVVSTTELALRGSTRWWWLAIISASTAVFSKETFATFTVPVIIVGLYRGGRLDRWMSLVALLSPVTLAAILGPDLLRQDSDIYGRPLGNARTHQALDAMTTGTMRWWMIATILAVVVWTVEIRNSDRRARVFVVALVSWLAVAPVVDIWFNYGQLGQRRYRAVLDVCVALQFVGIVIVSFRHVRRPIASGIVTSAVGVAAIAAIGGIVGIHDAAEVEARATVRFTEEIAAVDGGDVAVVVSAVGSYERAATTLRYLYRADSERHSYLVLYSDLNGRADLVQDLEEIAWDGSERWRASPRRDMPHQLQCVFINTPVRDADYCSTSTTVNAPD